MMTHPEIWNTGIIVSKKPKQTTTDYSGFIHYTLFTKYTKLGKGNPQYILDILFWPFDFEY